MHAGLAGEHAKCELASDGEGGGLDTGLVAILDFVDVGLEAFALGPAEIHAHEHLGPVLALGAAGAGVHDDNGVERIGLAGEHGFGFELVGELDERGNFAGEVGLGVFAFLREFEVGLYVI